MKDEIFEEQLNVHNALISKIVSRYVNRFRKSLERDDCRQEALIGFLHAVKTYRDDCGASFTTYATLCIRSRLSKYVGNMLGKWPVHRAIVDQHVVDGSAFAEQLDAALHDVPCRRTSRFTRHVEAKIDAEKKISHLTRRQQVVLILLSCDVTASEIARIYGVSPQAIQYQRDHALHRASNNIKTQRNTRA